MSSGGPYSRSDREVMARIRRSPGGKAGYKQLIRELGLGGGRERRLLLEQLTRMVARGELVRAGDEMWSIPKREPDAAPAKSNGQPYPGRRGLRPAGLRPAGSRWQGFEEIVRSGRERLV